MLKSWHPETIIAKVIGIFAGLIFVVSVIVHFATFAPSIRISMDLVWPLHLAIFIPFGGMVIILSRTKHRNIDYRKKSLLNKTGESYARSFDIIGKIARMIPTPLLVLSIAVFVYVPINFVLFCTNNANGPPEQVNGQYQVTNRDGTIQKLTIVEYQKYQSYEVRGFSGHWMIFTLVPFIYFGYVHRKIDNVKAMDLMSFPD